MKGGHGKTWTAKEDATLRLLWGEFPLAEIARRLGRTPDATYFHAANILGLPRGCPQGHEYISHAAARTGYTTRQLRAILKLAGVRLRVTMSRPSGPRIFTHHCVDPHDVDEAVAIYHQSETLSEAAARVGCKPHTLRRRLTLAGVKVAAQTALARLDPKVVDRAMAMETLLDAAARLRVDRNTMLAAIRESGTKKTTPRYWMLDPAVWDRALTEHVARTGRPGPRKKAA